MPSISQTEFIQVEGYRELTKAFRRAGPTMNRELRARVREAAKPVADDAQSLAIQEITNIGDKWSRMRVGITTREVYVAPRQRGVKSNANLRRPNLAPKLMDDAMQPALDRNISSVEKSIDAVLRRVSVEWEK